MLARLFKDVLCAKAPDGTIVFDYGNSDDFSTLWATDSDGLPAVLNKFNQSTAVVIIWEGFPPANDIRADKLLDPHLTPLDWALTFSTAVIEKRGDIPDLCIQIVDLTGKKFEEAWSIRMRHQLLAEMPWVRLHAPLFVAGEVLEYRQGFHPILAMTDLPALTGLLAQEHDGSWKLTREGKSLSDCARRKQKIDLKNLAGQWAATLTQGDDHHDVNNIIGPDILTKSDRKRGGIYAAFLARLLWSGRDLEAACNWKEWNAGEQIEKYLFGRVLTVYIIDDQLQQGWGRFLCQLLKQGFDENSVLEDEGFTRLSKANGDTQKIGVLGCQSSKPLIEFLRTRASFDRRDFTSQLARGDTYPELIFLDLRLYSGTEEIRLQTKQLIGIIKERLGSGLAWPPIDSSELSRIQEWCDRAREDGRITDEAQLLLPRLLALALPLTPIILFSSTGQSWIRERLKPFRNILTGFEKPRVLSDPTSVSASLASLREALNSAVAIMRLRLQLAHAQLAAKIAERQRPAKSRITNNHIEIYADETRTLEEGIVSGLAVCIYANTTSAEALQTRLLAEHGRLGTVWAGVQGREDSPALAKGLCISKNGPECERQTTLLAKLLNACQLTEDERALWSGVAMRVPPAKPASAGPVSISAFPDGPLDQALRFNLEFVLYALIPYFSADDGFQGTIHVYLPTRRVPYTDPAFAQELCEAFDLGIPREVIVLDRSGNEVTKWLISSASLNRVGEGRVGSAFPLVRGWLQEATKSSREGLINRIRKIKMNVLGSGNISPDQAKNRQLFHDIADWVCTASGQLRDGAEGNWIWPLREQLIQRKLFPNWFVSTDGKISPRDGTSRYQVDSDNALRLMNALKVSFGGASSGVSGSDVLRLLLHNSYVRNCENRLLNNEYCVQQRVILWALRRELESASGQSLHALLASDFSLARSSP